MVSSILGTLTLLSLGLVLWQWIVGRRFPLHQRRAPAGSAPPVTLLKPLKDFHAETADCLRSWFTQSYHGQVQILFGVASRADPVCEIVLELMQEYFDRDAQLIVCNESLGANAKVSTLIQLHRHGRYDIVVISDDDVSASSDLLTNMVQGLSDPNVGLVNCFYRLANPSTMAMRWEAIAINADFWSQVLQSRSLKPVDFALGAVMTTRREELESIGGFSVLADYLADDYRLGNLIARMGRRIAICPVVVDCRHAPQRWSQVWSHQLRWARTIRVCEPGPYFFSILSNATLWPLIWILLQPSPIALGLSGICLAARLTTAARNYSRMSQSSLGLTHLWLILAKDLLQAAIWMLSFFGRKVSWRGQQYHLLPDGQLITADAQNP
jgi:ceramide glucosyltransferase